MMPSSEGPRPESDPDDMAISLRYNTERSSRYAFSSEGAMPPGLSSLAKELAKQSQRDRDFPGVGLPPQIRDSLRNVIDIRNAHRGAADDIIRALMNFGILIDVEINGHGRKLIYDAESLKRVCDGETLSEPDEDTLNSRAQQLLQPFLEEPAPESQTQSKAVSELPDAEQVLLTLMGATVTLQQGRDMQIDGVLTKPREELLRAYPAVPESEIQECIVNLMASGHLVHAGPEAYIVCVEPVAVRADASSSLMNELAELRRKRDELKDELKELQERQKADLRRELLQLDELLAEEVASHEPEIRRHFRHAKERLLVERKQNEAMEFARLEGEFLGSWVRMLFESQSEFEAMSASLSVDEEEAIQKLRQDQSALADRKQKRTDELSSLHEAEQQSIRDRLEEIRSHIEYLDQFSRRRTELLSH